MAEVFSVEKFSSGVGVLITIDSGACMSTCPKAWCGWSQIVPLIDVPKAVTATGKPLTVYGMRRARCRSWNGLEFELKFVVSD
eukprot:1802851-Heterocapsa_arctica.AAC.1